MCECDNLKVWKKKKPKKVESENSWLIVREQLPSEMTSFMLLSQYRDTKPTFYLFYKIIKVFSSFRDVVHISVL